MKIGNKGNVTSLKFTHKGLDRHFCCQIPIETWQTLDSFKPEERIEIQFDDIRELDFMIDMLGKFRMECMDRIGLWAKV